MQLDWAMHTSLIQSRLSYNYNTYGLLWLKIMIVVLVLQLISYCNTRVNNIVKLGLALIKNFN